MDDSQPTKQVCGVCGDEWLTEAEYNNHVCPKTGYTPENPEHLINSTTPEFAEIQQAAIARGSSDDGTSDTPDQPDTASDQPAAPTINLN